MPTGSAHVARGTSPGILSVCGVRNVGCGGSTARTRREAGPTPPRRLFTNLAWVLAWVLVSFVVWELVLKLVSTRGVFPFKLCLDSFSRSPQVWSAAEPRGKGRRLVARGNALPSRFSAHGRDQLFARRPVPSSGSLRLPLRHKFQYRNEPVMAVKTNHTYSTTKMRGAAFASRLVLEVAPVSGNACRAAHS
jgi:hypothetical protein